MSNSQISIVIGKFEMKLVSSGYFRCFALAVLVFIFTGCGSKDTALNVELPDKDKAEQRKKALESWGDFLEEQSDSAAGIDPARAELLKLQREYNADFNAWRARNEASGNANSSDTSDGNPGLAFSERFFEFAESYSGSLPAMEALAFVVIHGSGSNKESAMNSLYDYATSKISKPDGSPNTSQLDSSELNQDPEFVFAKEILKTLIKHGDDVVKSKATSFVLENSPSNVVQPIEEGDLLKLIDQLKPATR